METAQLQEPHPDAVPAAALLLLVWTGPATKAGAAVLVGMLLGNRIGGTLGDIDLLIRSLLKRASKGTSGAPLAGSKMENRDADQGTPV